MGCLSRPDGIIKGKVRLQTSSVIPVCLHLALPEAIMQNLKSQDLPCYKGV